MSKVKQIFACGGLPVFSETAQTKLVQYAANRFYHSTHWVTADQATNLFDTNLAETIAAHNRTPVMAFYPRPCGVRVSVDLRPLLFPLQSDTTTPPKTTSPSMRTQHGKKGKSMIDESEPQQKADQADNSPLLVFRHMPSVIRSVIWRKCGASSEILEQFHSSPGDSRLVLRVQGGCAESVRFPVSGSSSMPSSTESSAEPTTENSASTSTSSTASSGTTSTSATVSPIITSATVSPIITPITSSILTSKRKTQHQRAFPNLQWVVQKMSSHQHDHLTFSNSEPKQIEKDDEKLVSQFLSPELTQRKEVFITLRALYEIGLSAEEMQAISDNFNMSLPFSEGEPLKLTLYNAQDCLNPFAIEPTLTYKNIFTGESVEEGVAIALTDASFLRSFRSMLWVCGDVGIRRLSDRFKQTDFLSPSQYPVIATKFFSHEVVHLSKLRTDEQLQLYRQFPERFFTTLQDPSDIRRKAFLFKRGTWQRIQVKLPPPLFKPTAAENQEVSLQLAFSKLTSQAEADNQTVELWADVPWYVDASLITNDAYHLKDSTLNDSVLKLEVKHEIVKCVNIQQLKTRGMAVDVFLENAERFQQYADLLVDEPKKIERRELTRSRKTKFLMQ